jgi:hypothetical protein
MFAIRESQDAPKPHLHSTWNPKKGLDCGHRDELPKKGLELWPLDVPKKRIENERVARAAYNQPFVFCYISIPKKETCCCQPPTCPRVNSGQLREHMHERLAPSSPSVPTCALPRYFTLSNAITRGKRFIPPPSNCTSQSLSSPYSSCK